MALSITTSKITNNYLDLKRRSASSFSDYQIPLLLNMSTSTSNIMDAAENCIILPLQPPFFHSLHSKYIAGLSTTLKASYEGAVVDHLKMSGVYWSLAGMSLLLQSDQVDEAMGLTLTKEGEDESIVDWVMSCFDANSGAFGGQQGQNGHLLYTLSAIQILAIANKLHILETDKIVDFITSLQQPDGSFAGDSWGEIDTRFTYCALSALSILKRIDAVNVNGAVDYVLQCRNLLDGGFGAIVGGESHAGQVFCCIGALSIAEALDKLPPDDILTWWLAERQCDSGGLNGRSEKQADVCYSWWILSSLSILGRMDWISQDKLAAFILQCQDPDDGGIADRPEDMPDVFHTFFGVAGLSLLGKLPHTLRQIDPVYALPVDVVQRLDLPGQVIQNKGQVQVEKRLQRYKVVDKSMFTGSVTSEQ